MSDVKTEKMELEFRSADDLFQNYPISIIRQVVDKSKATIDSKRQEMRRLVGAKYTDLLLSANTMGEMHNTFSTVKEDVSTVMNIIENASKEEVKEETILNDNAELSENRPPEVDVHDFFFPEYLFGLYDQGLYVDVISNVLKAKQILETDSSSPGWNHMQWGIISEFPRLVEEGSKRLFLNTETDNAIKSDCLVALSLYYKDLQRPIHLYLDTVQEYEDPLPLHAVGTFKPRYKNQPTPPPSSSTSTSLFHYSMMCTSKRATTSLSS